MVGHHYNWQRPEPQTLALEVPKIYQNIKNCIRPYEYNDEKHLIKIVIPGIFFTTGTLWQEQRRFALKNLREYGFSRRQDELESEMNDETLNLINFIKNGPKYEFEKVFDIKFS